MSGKMPSEPRVPYPDCGFCKDTGIVHMPNFPPAYRFCKCAKGIARQAAEPGLCDESNARELALGIGVKR